MLPLKAVLRFSFLLAIPLLLASSVSKTDTSLLIGRWQLQSYGYNTNGTMMDLVFADSTWYTFNADFTGTIEDHGVKTDFTWKKKGKRIGLQYGFTDKLYLVTEQSATKLTLVDCNGGTDAHKTYAPYEKGLIFRK